MAEKKSNGFVTFWESGLGHTVRDGLVTFGTTLFILSLDWVQGVELPKDLAPYAFLIPILVTSIKASMHLKDKELPNLPTSLKG